MWILNVLVLRRATDGETQLMGQYSGLVDLRAPPDCQESSKTPAARGRFG